ncbi:MAG: serine/threonine protein kinase [Myxococcales bacterium]|nr:serine/threonine protein kinase [Myxococcales bacterium]MCB9735649.1 serine/threonine protein kinase [Deltaproteobacteria bacterium]
MPELAEPTPDFGRYKLIRRVSLGGSAEIYKAKAFGERGFEKVVALKRILPHAEENPEFVRMFVDEAQLVAQLDHPLIAKLYELGHARGSTYIAMEYIYGRDLQELQRTLRDAGRTAPLALVAAVGAQAAEALAYAHAFVDTRGIPLRIVHRDVSPQNLMVTDAGAVKLIDFGIARFVGRDAVTETGVVKGKHAYMSPEQVRGQPLDGRSDLFSLGVILYELVTGRRLFKAESVIETLEQVTAGDVPPLGLDCPPELRRWIMRCLSKRPEDRPRDGRVLAQGLRDALGGLDAAAPAAVVQREYTALFGERDVTEDEVTLDEYYQALRAAELGEDLQLSRREASDITIVPDTADLAAYVEELRRHLREAPAVAAPEAASGAPSPPTRTP